MISILVAYDLNRAIGVENRLPWHLSADLKRFRQLTTGNTVVMGRKTYESIGKPLLNRTNVVVTRNRDLKIAGCKVVHNLDEAFLESGGDVFLIGGAELYQQALPHVDKILATEIETAVPKADAFFPPLEKGRWKVLETGETQTDEQSGLRFRYVTYVRV